MKYAGFKKRPQSCLNSLYLQTTLVEVTSIALQLWLWKPQKPWHCTRQPKFKIISCNLWKTDKHETQHLNIDTNTYLRKWKKMNILHISVMCLCPTLTHVRHWTRLQSEVTVLHCTLIVQVSFLRFFKPLFLNIFYYVINFLTTDMARLERFSSFFMFSIPILCSLICCLFCRLPSDVNHKKKTPEKTTFSNDFIESDWFTLIQFRFSVFRHRKVEFETIVVQV
jgi:hypothetical protein